MVRSTRDHEKMSRFDAAKDDDILRGLPPSQQVVRIVRDEMVALFGDAEGGSHAWPVDENNRPNQIQYGAQGLRQITYTPGGLVDVPGGRLSVQVTPGTTVLTGPAVLVSAGALCPEWLAG